QQFLAAVASQRYKEWLTIWEKERQQEKPSLSNRASNRVRRWRRAGTKPQPIPGFGHGLLGMKLITYQDASLGNTVLGCFGIARTDEYLSAEAQERLPGFIWAGDYVIMARLPEDKPGADCYHALHYLTFAERARQCQEHADRTKRSVITHHTSDHGWD